MKEVSKEEFFKKIGPLNVEVKTVGNYPYTSEFTLKSGRILVGKIVSSFPKEGRYPLVKTHFIIND